MKDPFLADQAARLLREARSRIAPVRTATPADAIAQVAEVIHRSAVFRRRRRGLLAVGVGAGVCAAAAVLLLALRGSTPAPAPSVAQQRPVAAPVMASADGGATLARAGDRLRTQGGSVQLYAGDGTSLRVAPASDLQLVRADAERWLRLGAGAVSVHVAKLKAGERFVIMTPDAEVEVHGTRFEVDVVPPAPGCGDGTVTRVVVTEGVVEVRGPGGADVRVPAGSRWPACPLPAPAASVPASGAMASAGAGLPRARSRAVSARTHAVAVAASRPEAAASAAPPASSTLATENDLFSSALRAEHNGDHREAVELLDVLLARFPSSPLRASAVSARDRLSRSLPTAP